MDAKSDDVVDTAGQSSKLGGNEGATEESLKMKTKAITLYVPPLHAAYPTWITYIDAAAIDICDRQGNIDSQCYISDNTIAAISQVSECKTNLKYVRKIPSKRNRQPSKVYQSRFVSVFDSGSKDKEVIQMHKKLKYLFEGHNINGPYAKDLFSKFSIWMSAGLYNPHATKKKAKLDTTSEYRYTTVNCVFMNYIHDTYTHYHRSHSEIDLSSHDENVRSMKVVSVERFIWEIMQGLCTPAVIVLKERCIRVYDSMKGHRGHADEIKELSKMLSTYLTIFDFFEKKDRTDWSLLDADKKTTDQHAFDVHIVDGIGIVQQLSVMLDCGLFVAAYAEFLSDWHQIPSSKFDLKKYRTRYASLLWELCLVYRALNKATFHKSSPVPPSSSNLSSMASFPLHVCFSKQQ
ncbi:hypothetical protein CQW23_21778 [Capsicum baccatum]|uniref:Ubiquitin-like protease family profile domain-containing protein n=1 Tax=Capsicum baccatum TaxID=33114 RepID=A0A2G2VZ03_CAPBA|nr:hypothetical protein CQW23_21778 [Capsicum baccatum]